MTMIDRRWYDQEPACRKMIAQIKAMHQEEVQDTAARVIINLAERIRKLIQKNQMGGLSSIGIPGIASLYRFGSSHQRWYDKRPAIQKAVSLLYMLPPEGLSALGFKLGDTLGLISVYSNVCHQVEQPPDEADIVRICQAALQDGYAEAEEVLINIVGKDLYEAISAQMRREL